MRIAVLLLVGTTVLGACERSAPPSKSGATSDTWAGPTTATTTATAQPTSSTTAPFPIVSGAAGAPGMLPVVAGSSCKGHGAQVTAAKDASSFTRKGDVWSRNETWGCGCPTGPVFTLVYTPKTSPLEVRLCDDPEADHCEALCRKSLDWDLSAAMKDAGATDVKFVNPP